MSAHFNYLRAFSIVVCCIACLVPGAYAQKQSGRSAFTARLVNIESTLKEPFRFNASLYNGSGRTQLYEFQALAPAGWNAVFRTEGSQVAGLRLDSGRTQEISVELSAPPLARPGKFKVPVIALSAGDTLRLELEAVVKGSHSVELSTPTGRLSDDVTEGSRKQILLTVKNTGTLPLEGLELSSQTPANWSASFEPSRIDRLEPGKTQQVTAMLNVPDKTIAGDYVTNFTARNEQANSAAAFRMTVKTSLLSGWLGILVILCSAGIVYYLIRKYGRR